MTINRAQLRTFIREELRDFYDQDTVSTGGIDASATTLPVAAVNRYSIGDLLTIESEILIVEGIDSANDQLTVRRGARESTAAAHSLGVAIKIGPEWTDRALNQTIDLAIGDTYDRQNGIWIETIDETLSTDTSVREYTIPAGFTYINEIQVADADGFYHTVRQWTLVGTKIQFLQSFANTGRTIRVIGTSFQALLTDDSTNLTIGDESAQFVWKDAAWHAVQQRFAHRLKAIEYSASVNDRAGQPVELLQMASNLRRTVEQLKIREFKSRPNEYSMTSRR